jgi:hypothetical protein
VSGSAKAVSDGLVTQFVRARHPRAARRLAALASMMELHEQEPEVALAFAERRARRLAAAVETVPFYAARPTIDAAGDASALQKLLALPIVRRDERRLAPGRFVAKHTGTVRAATTSGTSGAPTSTAKTAESVLYRGAVERRWFKGLGLPPSFRVIKVRADTWDSRAQRSFHDWRVGYLDIGFPTANELLRSHQARRDLILAEPAVLERLATARLLQHACAVASSFATLEPDSERVVREHAHRFGETYVAGEVSVPIAVRYPECVGMHVNEDVVVVEVVDDNGATVPPGVTGRLLVTDLVNEAMPVLRYEIGDVGSLEPAPCRCGRQWAVVRVTGRIGAGSTRSPDPARHAPHPRTRLSNISPPPAEGVAALRRVASAQRASRRERSNLRVFDSASMRPLIRGSANVVVRWGQPTEGVTGGLGLMTLPDGMLAVHRLARFRRDADGRAFVLQGGDNFHAGDPYAASWIAAVDVLGIVETIILGERKINLDWWGARACGRLVARLICVAWHCDRSPGRRVLAPAAAAFVRVAASLAAAVVKTR